MKIEEILRYEKGSHFIAIYVCEHCGKTEEGKGYDDSYFRREVIPEMSCKNCGKKSDENDRPLSTKYPVMNFRLKKHKQQYNRYVKKHGDLFKALYKKFAGEENPDVWGHYLYAITDMFRKGFVGEYEALSDCKCYSKEWTETTYTYVYFNSKYYVFFTNNVNY